MAQANQAPVTSHAVSINNAANMLQTFLIANLVPFITGSPGVGKSAIVHALAEKNNLKVIDLRLAQCDPTELSGFPTTYTDADNIRRAGYIPMDTFPVKGSSLPINPKTQKPYSGWLLFLDEMNSAPASVIAAAYKLCLDRMVGQLPLHENVRIVAAGNLETDRAIVNEMSSAMKSRLVHLETKLVPEEFLDYAQTNQWHPMITAYLGFKPQSTYTFNPDSSDATYACPRSWEFMNKLLATGFDISASNTAALPTIVGTIGSVGAEFLQFSRLAAADLPSIAQIVADPINTPIPNDLGLVWALMGTLADAASKDLSLLTPLVEYVSRLAVEHQVVYLRDVIKRNKQAMAQPVIQKWITTNSAFMF